MEDSFSEIAALIGDKTRAKMLWSLLDGRAYTSTELAIFADISKQSCSNHLLKLVNGGILKVEKQGRHRYYRFFDDKIAQVIEGIAYLLPPKDTPQQNKVAVKGIKYARTCYDHFAGKVGVEITRAMVDMELIIRKEDQFDITENGNDWFDNLGIDLNLLRNKKRKFAFPCLDWSERKFHIGGALGAGFLNFMLENDWIRRVQHSRVIMITSKGRGELKKKLNLEVN